MTSTWKPGDPPSELELLRAEVKRLQRVVECLEKERSDEGWRTNPDRMGGGGWTPEELDQYRWK